MENHGLFNCESVPGSSGGGRAAVVERSRDHQDQPGHNRIRRINNIVKFSHSFILKSSHHPTRATDLTRIKPAQGASRKDATTQRLYCVPATPDFSTGPGHNNQRTGLTSLLYDLLDLLFIRSGRRAAHSQHGCLFFYSTEVRCFSFFSCCGVRKPEGRFCEC